MVGGPASTDAVERARRLPSLKVGLHIVLVEGRSLLPPARVPALLDGSGHFHDNMARASLRIFLGRTVRRQLVSEITAQFEAYAATGLVLDHVDCHKHFHLHPTIARYVVEIGQRYGMRALRVPAEPAAVLRRIESRPRSPLSLLTSAYAARLMRRVRAHGLRTADQVFGLAWSGAVTEARLVALLEHLPPGTSEIYLHPATADSFPGAAVGYRYTDEFAALTAPRVVSAIAAHDIALRGYGDVA